MVRLKVNSNEQNEIILNLKEQVSQKVSFKVLKDFFSSVIKTKGLKSSVKNGDLLVGYIDDHNNDEMAHSEIISNLNTRLDRQGIEIDKKINSSSLADVAISGSYNDLTDKPSGLDIPTHVSSLINDAGYITSSSVGNGTITITQGGETKGSFSTNQNGNTTIEIEEKGSGRNIGEIVQSTIPLTDAGLHLLDGALIDGTGIYSAFVDYIASIYDASASYFTTEASWQDSVTNYGVCGKFVYDSVNNTVRLPKYSNKIYTKGINSTAPVVGSGKSLGLTNGTSTGALAGTTQYLSMWTDIYGANIGTVPSSAIQSNRFALGVTTDTTKSGLIAQLSNITTSVDGYYYIVIATSTKTNIQVDIDEIATDLNGKADVDLTNVNNAGTSRGASWAMPSNTYIDLTLGASGTTYTAPANGYFYFNKTTGSIDNAICNMFTNKVGISMTSNNNNDGICAGFIPVLKGDILTVNYTINGTTNLFRFIYAQGSESEAQ